MMLFAVASVSSGCQAKNPEQRRAIVTEPAPTTSEPAPTRSEAVQRAGEKAPRRLTQGQDTPVDGHRLGVMWLKGPDDEHDAARARVSVFDEATRKEREVVLREGDVIELGDRSYRVSKLEMRSSSRDRGYVELELDL